MKRFMMTIVIVLFVGGLGFGQLPLSDVPANHWGYEAVKYLLEAGIVSGMPDGTYQGNQPGTRYQIATYIYRTIEYMKSSLPYLKAEDLAGFSKELNSMRALVDSVAQNAENIGSQYQKLQSQINSLSGDSSELSTLKTTLSSHDSRLNSLENAQSSNRSTLSSLQGTTSGLSSKISSLEGQIRGFDSDIASVKNSVTGMNQNFSDYDRRVKSVESLLGGVNVLELKSSVSKNTDSISAMQGTFNAMNAKLGSLEDIGASNSSRLGTLESSLSAQKLQVSNMSRSFDSLGTQVENMSADYESFKGDILPKVSKNSSDVLTNSRRIQEIDLKFDATIQEFNGKLGLPTWLGVGGVVLGAAGVGVGVYSLIYAQSLNKKLEAFMAE